MKQARRDASAAGNLFDGCRFNALLGQDGRACCDQRVRDPLVGGDLRRERSRSRLRLQLEILQLQ